MGTQSTAKQVLDSIKTGLAAIVSGTTNAKGYTYNYTPGGVALVNQWRDIYFRDEMVPDITAPLYLVRDTGDEVPGLQPSFGQISRTLDVPVLCAMRDRRGDRNPFTATTTESDIREHMVGDVIASVMVDRGRGAVAFDTQVERVDRERFREGWIAAEVLFTVTYFHADSNP